MQLNPQPYSKEPLAYADNKYAEYDVPLNLLILYERYLLTCPPGESIFGVSIYGNVRVRTK